jgi:hypothetical protein
MPAAGRAVQYGVLQTLIRSQGGLSRVRSLSAGRFEAAWLSVPLTIAGSHSARQARLVFERLR